LHFATIGEYAGVPLRFNFSNTTHDIIQHTISTQTSDDRELKIGNFKLPPSDFSTKIERGINIRSVRTAEITYCIIHARGPCFFTIRSLVTIPICSDSGLRGVVGYVHTSLDFETCVPLDKHAWIYTWTWRMEFATQGYVIAPKMLARKGDKGMGVEHENGLGLPSNHFRHLRSNLGDGLS
jgi:hypothetical protein